MPAATSSSARAPSWIPRRPGWPSSRGAQYVVSPYFNADTVRMCNRYRVACMPGAMSIAEVVAGMEAGADIIKVFPGELFGPKIIKSIHGPIPQAELMPTGGVSVENVAEWIRAGAVAVGAGSSLTAGAKTGDYDLITKDGKGIRRADPPRARPVSAGQPYDIRSQRSQINTERKQSHANSEVIHAPSRRFRLHAGRDGHRQKRRSAPLLSRTLRIMSMPSCGVPHRQGPQHQKVV